MSLVLLFNQPSEPEGCGTGYRESGVGYRSHITYRGCAESPTANLTGQGALSATGTADNFASADLSGTGTLTAIPTLYATAALTGTGTLEASGHYGARADLTGEGTLEVAHTRFSPDPGITSLASWGIPVRLGS